MTLAQKFPGLHATVLDFPNVCKVGEEFAAASEPFVGDRVKFLGGNALETEYPKDQVGGVGGAGRGGDTVLLASAYLTLTKCCLLLTSLISH